MLLLELEGWFFTSDVNVPILSVCSCCWAVFSDVSASSRRDSILRIVCLVSCSLVWFLTELSEVVSLVSTLVAHSLLAPAGGKALDSVYVCMSLWIGGGRGAGLIVGVPVMIRLRVQCLDGVFGFHSVHTFLIGSICGFSVGCFPFVYVAEYCGCPAFYVVEGVF